MKLKKVFQVTLFFFAFGILILLVYVWVISQPTEKINSNYQKWKTSQITHYRFSLKISCFCGFYDDMPVIVEVEDNEVVSVVDNKGNIVSITENSDGTYNEYAHFADRFTIEGLFAYVRKALQEADEVNIQYDKDFGFPKQIGIDWRKYTVDDEIGLSITNFEVIP